MHVLLMDIHIDQSNNTNLLASNIKNSYSAKKVLNVLKQSMCGTSSLNNTHSNTFVVCCINNINIYASFILFIRTPECQGCGIL